LQEKNMKKLSSIIAVGILAVAGLVTLAAPTQAAAAQPQESHLCVNFGGGAGSTCYNSGFHAHGTMFGCVPELGDAKPKHVTIGAHMYGHITMRYAFPFVNTKEFDFDGFPHETYVRWNNGASEWGNAVGWSISTDQHVPGGSWLSLVNISCKHTACGCKVKGSQPHGPPAVDLTRTHVTLVS
jgi:hypothetical protein